MGKGTQNVLVDQVNFYILWELLTGLLESWGAMTSNVVLLLCLLCYMFFPKSNTSKRKKKRNKKPFWLHKSYYLPLGRHLQGESMHKDFRDGTGGYEFLILLAASAHSAVNGSAPVQKWSCFSCLWFHTISPVTVAWKALK